MAAGTGLPPQWIRYWTVGAGAAVIGWDSPGGGDYERCITAVQAKVTEHGEPPLTDHVIHGLCATLHKIATGRSPGHGPVESATKPS